MKNYIVIILGVVLATLISCENQEVDFPDFDYNAVYFPIQFPVRTLSLGDDRIDNEGDKNLEFKIGVSIGGMYENKSDRLVEYVVDNTLADSLHINYDGEQVLVEALPSTYYTIVNQGQTTIPSGFFDGEISVSLTQAFLDLPLAYANKYVIPLRITSADADSILSGMPIVDSADKRNVADWASDAPPKDFVLYGIKFVNEYHGKYLRRGVDYVSDAANTPTDTNVYHEDYIVRDQPVDVLTKGRNTVYMLASGTNVGDAYKLAIEVANGGSVSIDSVPGMKNLITGGSGSFVEAENSTEEWGYKKRAALYLNYTFIDESGNNHNVYDTLVFRDRATEFEVNEFTEYL